ncbi:MAG: hypothetical protein WBR35_25525 [Anaerolineae bacterium]
MYAVLALALLVLGAHHLASSGPGESESIGIAQSTRGAQSAGDSPNFSCADVSEIPQIECEALVASYSNTNGAGHLNAPCVSPDVIARRQDYQVLKSNYFDEHNKEAAKWRAAKRLEQSGFHVELTTVVTVVA